MVYVVDVDSNVVDVFRNSIDAHLTCESGPPFDSKKMRANNQVTTWQ